MKAVAFSQSGRVVQVNTQANVLQALLAEQVPVKMACGGRGLCATCHVYIEQGDGCVTPPTKREKRTLALIGEANERSRLACQAKVLSDGIVVRLPEGLYIERTADLDALVGRRAESRLLHPVNGRVLVEVGKIITRSTVRALQNVDTDVERMLAASREVG